MEIKPINCYWIFTFFITFAVFFGNIEIDVYNAIAKAFAMFAALMFCLGIGIIIRNVVPHI